ncbi:hypothetical protein PR048_010355 [Dryococelus australis]|uniref:Uncharacterized protein n=1 Tax=Dryococelus australis TaxID=614101 RepID=A0ABQ9I2I4_9NEOP|nr:hypothetical protein PR048_010355 [Dryococelus australis]
MHSARYPFKATHLLPFTTQEHVFQISRQMPGQRSPGHPHFTPLEHMFSDTRDVSARNGDLLQGQSKPFVQKFGKPPYLGAAADFDRPVLAAFPSSQQTVTLTLRLKLPPIFRDATALGSNLDVKGVTVNLDVEDIEVDIDGVAVDLNIAGIAVNLDIEGIEGDIEGVAVDFDVAGVAVDLNIAGIPVALDVAGIALYLDVASIIADFNIEGVTVGLVSAAFNILVLDVEGVTVEFVNVDVTTTALEVEGVTSEFINIHVTATVSTMKVLLYDSPEVRSGVGMIYCRQTAQLEEEPSSITRDGDENLSTKTGLGKVKEVAGIAERHMESARVCEAEIVASSRHHTAFGPCQERSAPIFIVTQCLETFRHAPPHGEGGVSVMWRVPEVVVGQKTPSGQLLKGGKWGLVGLNRQRRQVLGPVSSPASSKTHSGVVMKGRDGWAWTELPSENELYVVGGGQRRGRGFSEERREQFSQSANMSVSQQPSACIDATLDIGSSNFTGRIGLTDFIWTALNIEVLRADEGDMRGEWNSVRMKGRGTREIPEKTRRPAASSGTILTCENPDTNRLRELQVLATTGSRLLTYRKWEAAGRERGYTVANHLAHIKTNVGFIPGPAILIAVFHGFWRSLQVNAGLAP